MSPCRRSRVQPVRVASLAAALAILAAVDDVLPKDPCALLKPRTPGTGAEGKDR
jgi:hypothetical protein